ncbi:barstar family protein [Lysinibacillus sp. NPDC097287]|uniref:barstar family protein n=1 Tax=Lysinibacillus sp. NPDC097287 TaxID=3364144 RepID=UPI0037FAB5EF
MEVIVKNINCLNEPYVHFTFDVEKLINQFKLVNEVYKKDAGMFTTIIEGIKCTDKQSLFEEFSRKLNFPDYFGYNWDAFEECFTEFGWPESNKYVLFIKDFDMICLHDEEELDTFLECLDSAIKEWIIERDHGAVIFPPTPFHIVIDCNSDLLTKINLKFGNSKIEMI